MIHNKFKTENLPQHVQIEITRRCNLSCIMCPRETLDYKNNYCEDMSLSRFKIVIDKLPQGIDMISVHGLGEPLLHTDIISILDYASKKAPVLLVTNGTLLNEDMLKNILLTGITWFTISMDSPYKNDYEKIRRGANFDKLIYNIKLIAKGHVYSMKKIQFTIQMTVSDKNFDSLIDMITLCYELGIPNLNLLGIHTNTNEKIADFIDNYDNKIDLIKKYALDKDINLTINSMGGVTFSKQICRRPYKTLFVNCNGLAEPCCIHETPANLRTTIGNMFDSSFDEIWNGERMLSFREALENEKKPRMCTQCDHLFQ